MYLTCRDRDIIKYIEKYGSITINQCANIFFKDNKEAYYQARKRLHQIYADKHLKRFRKDMRAEAVYYITKPLKKHSLLLMDVYSVLINSGADIKLFEKEYRVKTPGKDYKIDGLIELEYQGFWYCIAIEIDYTHYTSKRKLQDIYSSGHFQERYKELGENIFPTIILVRDATSFITDDTYKVICCDYELSTLTQNLF